MRNRIALAFALLGLAASSASAHVTLAEPSAKAGSDYLAQFRVGHGCDGAPTTALSVEIPAGIVAAQPSPKDGWRVEKTGNTVSWKGGSLDPHQAGTFEVRLKLPNTPGPVYFPATQTCGGTVEHWSGTAGPEPMQHPAPLLTILAADATTMADGMAVSDGWMRALPAGLPSAGYFTLRNQGGKDRLLTGASSPACGMLMLHKSDDTGGMSAMQDVAEVAVPAGGSVSFAPGSYHLMCMDAKLAPGGNVPVTLNFKDGTKLEARFAVRNAAGK